MSYRVLPSSCYRPAQFALARRYSDLAEALANMGNGIVLDDDQRLVAAHATQVSWIEGREKS